VGEELKIAKAASVLSNNMWKAAQKPRRGPIFEKRKRCRSVYRQLLRQEEKHEKISYSNDLHEALLRKNGKMFWNSWQAKFDSPMPCSQVDGCVDDSVIINKFVDHFRQSYSCNNKPRAEALFDQFNRSRSASWVISYQLAMLLILSLSVKLFSTCIRVKHRIMWVLQVNTCNTATRRSWYF